jgi:hypothetical protein
MANNFTPNGNAMQYQGPLYNAQIPHQCSINSGVAACLNRVNQHLTFPMREYGYQYQPPTAIPVALMGFCPKSEYNYLSCIDNVPISNSFAGYTP